MTNPRRMQMAAAGQGGAGYFEISGNLWAAGEGEWLGDNSTTSKSSPVQIKSSVTDWAQAYIGTDSAVAITNTGDIYDWGEGSQAAVTGPNTGNLSSPVLIRGSAGSGGWSALSGGGGNHWAAIKDGKLYTCGSSGQGEGGHGDTTSRSSPVQVGSLTNWASVHSSDRAHFAINTDGEMFSWGYNSYGRLALGDTTNRSSPVQVGSLTNWLTVNFSGYTPAALKTDGTLWAWGFGSHGANGQGDTVTHSSPVQVGSATNWTKVRGNAFTLMAINSDNELWVCGRNDDGQLGDGSTTNRSSLVQISGSWLDLNCIQDATAGIKTDGTLWTWGTNYDGALAANSSSPVQVGSLTSWIGCAGVGGIGNSFYYLR